MKSEKTTTHRKVFKKYNIHIDNAEQDAILKNVFFYFFRSGNEGKVLGAKKFAKLIGIK